MAKAKGNQLPLFEGAPVAKCALKVTKAGDGLSEALDLEPVALALGDERSYVIRGTIAQVGFKTANGIVTRVHTLVVDTCMEVDEAVAEKMISREAIRLAKLRDERTGQTTVDDVIAGAAAKVETVPDPAAPDPEPAEPADPRDAELDALAERREGELRPLALVPSAGG